MCYVVPGLNKKLLSLSDLGDLLLLLGVLLVKDAFCVWTDDLDSNTVNIIARKHVF